LSQLAANDLLLFTHTEGGAKWNRQHQAAIQRRNLNIRVDLMNGLSSA